MITRRSLFKNLGAAIVVGAVAPSTLGEAVVAPASELAVAGLGLLPYYPYPYSIVRLLTLMFGGSGWRVEEDVANPGVVDIHVPDWLDAASKAELAKMLWLYKPVGALFRLRADVPVSWEGAQLPACVSGFGPNDLGLMGIEVL